MNDAHVITRFPPSPTGSIHIGNIRTLLFNYLFTRKHGGEIYLRFEDTDAQRSDRVHEARALETFDALGLTYDHGPFRQSERTDLYSSAITKLIESDHAYVAEESTGEQGGRVVRFRNPNTRVSFHDLVRGEITIDTTDFGDFVIARSETSPVYHLSVVVDDIDMNISHVIRGEDHMTSTPRQILLIKALGGTVPTYAHVPLIVGEDKKKLGKRHGAVTYQEFRNMGILPDALVNYLALLGWNPGDDRELFTLDELIDAFSLERVQSSPATFSYKKLHSINHHYMRRLSTTTYIDKSLEYFPDSELGKLLAPRDTRAEVIVEHVLRERFENFSSIATAELNGEFTWMYDTPRCDVKTLVWKHATPDSTKQHLEYASSTLESLESDTWVAERIKNTLWSYAEMHGKGDVLWPIRYALTGQEKSPDPFTVASILGKDETLARLRAAQDLL